MGFSSRRIEEAMRRISRTQNSPPAQAFTDQNPIAGGLGRVANISQINGSQPNLQGFGQMISSLQLLRQVQNLDSSRLQSMLADQAQWPDPEGVPEPPLDPRFDVGPVEDESETDTPDNS